MASLKYAPIRYCTGGCSSGGAHHAHFYTTDPVDGPLNSEYLCPGNLGEVRVFLEEDGTSSGQGFIAIRLCYATVREQCRNGFCRPEKVGDFYDTPPDSLPEGHRVVRARVHYAANGFVRLWNILPD
jgi:hypothetical protein